MTSRAVDMYEIRVPLAVIEKLSDEDRFSYYLLGHIFNELMSLQKIVGFTLPRHEDNRPARVRPEHAQAMLLFRLASAKIWEASQAIRQNKQLATTLRTLVLPKMPGGTVRLKALNAAINAAPWLSPLRNGMGFHFPTFADWKPHVVPDETWVDDSIFLGDQSGNTFYDAADTVAQAWMFGQYGLPTARDAVDPLISQMIELLRDMNTFLEDALGTLIGEVILEGKGTRRLVGKVLSPQHDQVSIPFWTAMTSSKKGQSDG
ncbi:MAG TPA: hypothetical protein VF169_11295 [Albitalea sp.]|uniref:hypothetical protein n=1 Tax=Piscinibacter sp. TaxID=1903157 RepID=UPI002ED6422E